MNVKREVAMPSLLAETSVTENRQDQPSIGRIGTLPILVLITLSFVKIVDRTTQCVRHLIIIQAQ